MPENKNSSQVDIIPPLGKRPFIVGLESKGGVLQIVRDVYGLAFCDGWLVLRFKDVQSWIDATDLKDIKLNLQLK